MWKRSSSLEETSGPSVRYAHVMRNNFGLMHRRYAHVMCTRNHWINFPDKIEFIRIKTLFIRIKTLYIRINIRIKRIIRIKNYPKILRINFFLSGENTVYPDKNTVYPDKFKFIRIIFFIRIKKIRQGSFFLIFKSSRKQELSG